MPSPSSTPVLPWWQRRSPSLLVLAAVLLVLGLATVAVAGQVADVLPEVAKDKLGEDRWGDPLGLEIGGDLVVGHVPDCAAESPITRIVLWDADSEPYWEVAGPALPLTAFIVGATPKGFTEVEPYRRPPPGTVLRLVAFRRTGSPIGIRYRTSQLKTGRVVSGPSLTTYTVAGFQEQNVCTKQTTTGTETLPGETTVPGVPGAITTTTLPG